MKFEAEIIKEIVDSRGHEKTSIHYQSECVEEWVKEVEGAYPKLCDYQPEWLNYSAENKIGVFPYTTLTDVTNATVENVVPYAYKSTILKGQTLVNVAYFNQGLYNYTDYNLLFIDKTKSYFIKFNTTFETTQIGFIADNNTWNVSNQFNATKNGYVIIKPDEAKDINALRVRFNGNTDKSFIPTLDLICIEYQEGMENWDIPYFEGIQSVKLPGLTTVGKNLFDIDNVIQQEGVIIKDNSIHITENRDYPDNVIYTFENAPTESVLTFELTSNGVQPPGGALASIWYEDGTNIWITTTKKVYVNTKKITDIKIHNWCKGTHIFSNIQLEKGTTATSYEPYKTNILTVNEPVELRGIGDVSDTLDCLTGEVTERIGEIVLDGSEERWELAQVRTNTMRFNCYSLNIPYGINGGLLKTDKLPYQSPTIGDQEGAAMGGGNAPKVVSISIMKAKLPSSDIDGFKQWLSQNPITIQYQLATESIKTVDLSVVDQDGKSLEIIKPIEGTMHLNTTGESIKPLFSGEIPVEAITQNLASFIEE